MKTKRIFLAVVLAAGMVSCGKHQARQIVILPDVSASIDRKSLEQAFTAIDELAGRLRRGDRIAIIPILGDAQAEAQGRILRFEVPANRQAYDADLKSFRRKLAAALTAMQVNATAHPGSKTDILGSVALAEQEFQAGPSESKRMLVLLSDLIQEDTEINFRTDVRLQNPASAMKFAQEMAKRETLNFGGSSVYLGALRSDEYSHLAKNRRAAVKAFWISYFGFLGGKPEFVSDGTGLLESFQSK